MVSNGSNRHYTILTSPRFEASACQQAGSTVGHFDNHCVLHSTRMDTRRKSCMRSCGGLTVKMSRTIASCCGLNSRGLLDVDVTFEPVTAAAAAGGIWAMNSLLRPRSTLNDANQASPFLDQCALRQYPPRAPTLMYSQVMRTSKAYVIDSRQECHVM